MELFQKGTIRLGSNQMINHVDSRGKEDLDIVIAGSECYCLCREGLSSTRCADEDNVHAFLNKKLDRI